MKKLYMVMYSAEKVIDRNELIEFLKEKKAITYWEFCLPYSIFLESELSSKEISNLIEEKYGDINRVIIEGSKDNYWGILPKGYWDIFKK